MMTLALKVQHRVYHVLQHPRAGQGAVFGHVPGDQQWHVAQLGPTHQPQPALPHLHHAPRPGGGVLGVEGLDGIDDGQGWQTPEPAGVCDFCTPAKNSLAARHTREVIDPFIKSLRGKAAFVMFSLPGKEDAIRKKVYRSFNGRPTDEERKAGAKELDAKLKSFRYQGEPLPEKMALSKDHPVIDYFKQFPGLDARTSPVSTILNAFVIQAPVGATTEDIARIRREFGLTGSWWAQYGAFFLSLCRGNFGRSLWLQQDALRVILERLGGFKVQAKEFDAARALLDDAVALAEAGCFALVLECVPDAVATMVTEAVPVPTIGIGAGANCDGQVLVFHDLLVLNGGRAPKFVRRYADLRGDATTAVAAFADDVRSGRYPSEAETYHFADGTQVPGLYQAATA